MDFNSFLDDCRAQWPDFNDWRRMAKLRNPRDRDLQWMTEQVKGMATENKYKLLNLAVARLQPGEVYVEVGCWQGASLVAAATGNPDKQIWACDNFSQFGGPAEALQKNLATYTKPGQVHFFDMDYVEFLKSAPWRPATVGAYFYDGGHKFEEQYQGLRLALPWLSPDAFVMVDDTNKRSVRAANGLIERRAAGLELVLDLRTPRNHHPTWWNGVQVYRYRSNGGPAPILDDDFTYRLYRWFCDDIVLAARHRRRDLQQRVKRFVRGGSGKRGAGPPNPRSGTQANAR